VKKRTLPVYFVCAAVFLSFSNSAPAITEAEKQAASNEVAKALKSFERKGEVLRPRGEVTGLEWLQMSIGERTDSILYSMYVLTQHGVELAKTGNDYYNAVEEKLKLNPDLYHKDLTNILASIVYETEPGSREVLDQWRKDRVHVI
jgi:hypothetical protein